MASVPEPPCAAPGIWMYARGAHVLGLAPLPKRGSAVDSGHFHCANACRRALPARQSMRRRAPLDLRLE